jgi:hypothetical protein
MPKKFKNMLEPRVYRAVFKKHFRIPKYGSTKFVPFIPNEMQDDIINNMDFDNIILKARKEGISTVVLAMALVNCNEIPNYHAVFLADNEPNTKAIFSRVSDMIRTMEGFDDLDVDDTTSTVKFARTNARMEISTAGRKSAFRGSDIHFVHCSEIAFFKYPDVYEAVLEARNSGGIAFLESTANGRNLFFSLWQKAQGFPRESTFKPFFFGWDRHPEYRRETTDKFEYSAEEKLYVDMAKEIYGIILNKEQMAWRRWKLNAMPNPDKFPQEYPLTANEAFLSSGKPVFRAKKLDDMKQLAVDYRIGSIELNKAGELSWVDESVKGYLRMFEAPRPGQEYIIGADVAEGVEGGDFCAAYVMNAESGVQVAEFHGNLDPDQFAYELNKLARFYNCALLAVERNNHGYTVLSRLMNDYEYPRLYQEEKDMDSMISETTLNCGHRTNTKTRPLMVDLGKMFIRKGLVKINSVPCIDECLSFITTNTGKAMHDVGMHDDRVFAAMIAWFVWNKYADLRDTLNLHNKPSYYSAIGKSYDDEDRQVGSAGY